MIKVYQEDSSSTKGDCMRAVVASIFEEDLKDVPNFIEIEGDWFKVFLDYFNSRGYKHITPLYNPIMWKEESFKEHSLQSLDKLKEFKGINGLFYATVCSPTYNSKGSLSGITHAVVIDREFNIVYDPNPNYKNIKRKYPLHDKYNGVRQIEVFEKITNT